MDIHNRQLPTDEIWTAKKTASHFAPSLTQGIPLSEFTRQFRKAGSNGNELNAEPKTCRDTASMNQRHGNGQTPGKESGTSPIPG